MSNFWISWFHKRDQDGAFELHTPWWISGARIVADRFAFDEEREEPTIVAAIQAANEEDAKEEIFAAYDKRPADIEWRFCEPQPDDWSPFNGRFRKADWMKWPTTSTPSSEEQGT